jgi:hypothetical protein
MSPARLNELKDEVAAVRRRLEGWVSRLAELRGRAGGQPNASLEAPRSTPAPLFQGLGAGALEDGELHFEVLDTEDPGREGR